MRPQDRKAQLRRPIHLLFSGCPTLASGHHAHITALDDVTCPWCRSFIRKKLHMPTFEYQCRLAGLVPRGRPLPGTANANAAPVNPSPEGIHA